MNKVNPCKMCDENRHNEYGEPCMECHTFLEKQNALSIVERLNKRIEQLYYINRGSLYDELLEIKEPYNSTEDKK